MNNVNIVIIDSRSKVHKDWVERAILSAQSQTHSSEVTVIDNTENKKTIGQCWNAAVKSSKTDWIMFLGDDDFLARDAIETFLKWDNVAKKDNIRPVCITSYMTAFNEREQIPVQKPHTGMYRREYLLKYPFNEDLKKQVDRQYLEEVKKRNNSVVYLIPHYMGYYYRQHDQDRCAGTIHIGRPVEDLYIVSKFPKEVDKIFERVGRKYYIESKAFDPNLAKNAKAIWCDWADENAVSVSNSILDIPKFLVVRAYEVYLHWPYYIKFENFKKVIFIANHIKEYLEKKIDRKLANAVVITNGADLNQFTISSLKWSANGDATNNKVAYAGWISRKKGAGELILLAKELPQYEFHVAGKFAEEDVQEYFLKNKPKNMFAYPWQYNLNEWFEDKTYFLNTSIREGCPVTVLEAMAAGLKPLIYGWLGARNMFGNSCVWNDLNDLKRLLEGQVNPVQYRELIQNKFDLSSKIHEIRKILEIKN